MKRRTFLSLTSISVACWLPAVARGSQLAISAGTERDGSFLSESSQEIGASTTQTRQVFLDIQTTGIDWRSGDRTVEIGALEAINGQLSGRQLHHYLEPHGRKVDPGAYLYHGLSNEFLRDMPTFRDVEDNLIAFVSDADLVMHNADYHLEFIDIELNRHRRQHKSACFRKRIIDTLSIAHNLHPGQSASFDALSSRYGIPKPPSHAPGRSLSDAQFIALLYFEMAKNL